MTRRAIVCFVEGTEHLFQQVLALRRSWLHVQSPDTDLVVMGPGDVLERLPDDLVKIALRPATDDPVWRDYRYFNSIACLNGPAPNNSTNTATSSGPTLIASSHRRGTCSIPKPLSAGTEGIPTTTTSAGGSWTLRSTTG